MTVGNTTICILNRVKIVLSRVMVAYGLHCVVLKSCNVSESAEQSFLERPPHKDVIVENTTICLLSHVKIVLGRVMVAWNRIESCQNHARFHRVPEQRFLALLISVVDCGRPAPIDHVTMSGTEYVYQKQVTFACALGYERLSGDFSRTCQASGKWSGSPPICQGR